MTDDMRREAEHHGGVRLRLLTINIHKGFSSLNARFILHRLRDAIRGTGADIVFLQEVTGENTTKAALYDDWPEYPHHEFLADDMWPEFSYGRNAVYPHGHHGNALLSKYPIVNSRKFDISTNRFEQRGFLHSIISVPGMAVPLHCVCVHLGLSGVSRRKQITALRTHITGTIPDAQPLVLAGDFNDWRSRIRDRTLRVMGLSDVHVATHGGVARTYPSCLPLLPLDRIYIRGMTAVMTAILSKDDWSRLSDHAALYTEVSVGGTTAAQGGVAR